MSRSERVGGALRAILPALPVLGALFALACATSGPSAPVTGGGMLLLDTDRECARTEEPRLLNPRSVAEALQREYTQLLEFGRIEDADERRPRRTNLYLFIDALGIVTDSQVQSGSGSTVFDGVAMRTSRTGRFRSAMCDGEPVAVRITLPFTFTPG